MNAGDDDLGPFLRSLDGRDGVPDAGRLALLRARLRSIASRGLKPGDHLRRVMDSEDVAEDALYDLLHALPGFRGTSWAELMAFAEAVLRRRVVDNARHHHAGRRDVARAASLPLAEPAHPSTPTPSDDAATLETRRKIRLLVETLPEALREVVLLRLEGRDYAEIAAALDLTEPAARQRMTRALQLLKSRW